MKEIFYRLAFLYPKIYAFFCYYRKKERRKEIENKFSFFLRNQWNQADKKRIVRHIFELRGSRKMMRYLIPLIDTQFVKQFVKVEGLHHLDEVLKEGKGVVLMAGHFGNPHLSFNALRAMGYDVNVLKGGILRKQKHSRFQYFDSFENTIFVHDPSLPSEEKKGRILEVLQSGKIIYHPGDAGEGRIKKKVLFFGREVSFPTGMLHLAHQAKATIIPFIHLYEAGQITLIFKESIDGHWREGERDYERILIKFAALLETYILAYPEQYMGVYGPTVLHYNYRSYQDGGTSEGEG